jgi:hypothetical protein
MSQNIEFTEGFRIYNGSGFHVTFPNGYTVSVQFGPGNYSSNYDQLQKRDDRRDYREWSRELGEKGADTAEVAVVAPNGGGLIDLHEFDPEWTDTVAGYVTPAKVVELMVWTMLK